MNVNSEVLVGLSVDDLEALADTLLALSAQAWLDDLPVRNKEPSFSGAEQAELDNLLRKIDQLAVLKNKARLTLSQKRAPTVPA